MTLRPSTRASTAWQLDAACADADPDLFIAPFGENQHSKRRREAAAKAFCARCPVREACLNDALQAGDEHTIRGGLNAAERAGLHRGGRRRGSAEPGEDAA